MGAGMARSLLRAGLQVSVWNRSPEKAAALGENGAVVAKTVTRAVADADVVLTMLFDADAVLVVAREAQPAMAPEAVLLQSSTVGVEGTRRVAAWAAETGVRLLDAPVLGTRKPAEDGNLVVLVSGPSALRNRVAPVLGAIGSRTMWVGETPGPASALKLAVNSYVATVTAGIAQSLALTEAFGLDPARFVEAVAGGPLDAPYVGLKGSAMLADEFPVSFALDGLLKDVTLAVEAAGAEGLRAPLTEALREVYHTASSEGYGDEDIAAVHRVLRPDRPRPGS
jgi:3-hydroxyisobutyrate dehydrogenase